MAPTLVSSGGENESDDMFRIRPSVQWGMGESRVGAENSAQARRNTEKWGGGRGAKSAP